MILLGRFGKSKVVSNVFKLLQKIIHDEGGFLEGLRLQLWLLKLDFRGTSIDYNEHFPSQMSTFMYYNLSKHSPS